jgi:Holliday junction DNA helicase RuvB
MDDLIGQTQVKENLTILIAAALQRGEPLDHVLFYGPPGREEHSRSRGCQ